MQSQTRSSHRVPNKVFAAVLFLSFAALLLPSLAMRPTAASVLLGNQSLETYGDFEFTGTSEAFPFQAAATGTASSASLYIDAGSTEGQVFVGLYTNASGRPGSLLTSGSLAAPAAGAWHTFTLGATAVQAGTTYWLAVLPEGGTVHYRDRSPGTCVSSETSQTSLTALPATWSQGTTYTQCNLSAYVSGTTATTTPTPTPSTGSVAISNVSCTVTLNGVQQTGTCTGTFTPKTAPTPTATAPSTPTAAPTPAITPSPTAVPTPTPTVTPVPSSGWPSPANTGANPATVTQTMSGTGMHSVGDGTIANTRINGGLQYTGNGTLTLTNDIITVDWTNTWAAVTAQANGDLVLDHVTINGINVGQGTNFTKGFEGGGGALTVAYSNVQQICQNDLGAGPVNIHDNYIDNIGSGNGSTCHATPIEDETGGGQQPRVLEHNWLADMAPKQTTPNASDGIFLQDTFGGGNVGSLKIDDNFIHNGYWDVEISGANVDAPQVTNNCLDWPPGSSPLQDPNGIVTAWSGNTQCDGYGNSTGMPVPK